MPARLCVMAVFPLALQALLWLAPAASALRAPRDKPNIMLFFVDVRVLVRGLGPPRARAGGGGSCL
jgi:hypothetical protein